mmetsp:Transcript_119376/g.385424  ORF Transcript_119376/g.385424 Transcript_119376/m.385424 type:complete len:200 (+) Transcript_119376:1185-1784(+)
MLAVLPDLSGPWPQLRCRWRFRRKWQRQQAAMPCKRARRLCMMPSRGLKKQESKPWQRPAGMPRMPRVRPCCTGLTITSEIPMKPSHSRSPATSTPSCSDSTHCLFLFCFRSFMYSWSSVSTDRSITSNAAAKPFATCWPMWNGLSGDFFSKLDPAMALDRKSRMEPSYFAWTRISICPMDHLISGSCQSLKTMVLPSM